MENKIAKNKSAKGTKNKSVKSAQSLKNKKNIKVFSELKEYKPTKTGISYSVEPVYLDGKKTDDDIYKKYVDGNLVKQKVISKKKFNDIIKKMVFKRKGGENSKNIEDKKEEQPVVGVQDKTTFFQAFKTGMAFSIAQGIINGITITLYTIFLFIFTDTFEEE
jgi:hypothetical protein